jgi:hypothetical protein
MFAIMYTCHSRIYLFISETVTRIQKGVARKPEDGGELRDRKAGWR